MSNPLYYSPTASARMTFAPTTYRPSSVLYSLPTTLYQPEPEDPRRSFTPWPDGAESLSAPVTSAPVTSDPATSDPVTRAMTFPISHPVNHPPNRPVNYPVSYPFVTPSVVEPVLSSGTTRTRRLSRANLQLVLGIVGFGLAACVAIGVGGGLAVRQILAGVHSATAHPVARATTLPVQPPAQAPTRAPQTVTPAVVVEPATATPAQATPAQTAMSQTAMSQTATSATSSPTAGSPTSRVRIVSPRSGSTARTGLPLVLSARAELPDGNPVPAGFLRWTITASADGSVQWRQFGATVTVPAGRLAAGSYRVRVEVVVAGATASAERALAVR